MKKLLILIFILLAIPSFANATAFTSKVQTTGNWGNGATWLKATGTSITVTVAVAGGNVTFTRSAGDWTTNVSTGAYVKFAGFANAGNNVSFQATNVTTLVLTAVQGTAVAEGPTANITAYDSFVSPGVKGTDWPGTAGDTFTVSAGDTVIYNVSETNGLGNSTLNGKLSFSPTTNTLITMGNAANGVLAIGATGELEIGKSGTPIDSTHTAFFACTSSTAADCITIAHGGKLTVYGSTAWYGGTASSTLSANWTSGTSFTVTGDVSGWPSGGYITVHKNTLYSSVTTDTLQYSLNGTPTYSSGTGLSTITINEAAPGVTFYSGGVVAFVKRNVQFYKVSNQNPTTIGTYVTNGPKLTDNSTSINSNITINNAEFTGWDRMVLAYAASISNDVIRYSNSTGISYGSGHTITGCYIYSNSTGISYGAGHTITGCYIYSNSSGIIYGAGHTITGCYIYSNSSGINSGAVIVDATSSIGYNGSGVSVANSADVSISGSKVIFAGTKILSLSTSGRNTPGMGRISIGDDGQVVGAMRVLGSFGTMQIVNSDGAGGPPTRPTQRPNGSTTAMEITEQSTISTTYPFNIFPPTGQSTVRIWKPAGGAKTFRWYVSNPNAATLAAVDLSLTGTYLSAASGVATATITSTNTVAQRANAGDWTQYVEVAIPATTQSGWVDFHLQLTKYLASFILWIDPAYVVY